MAEDILGRFDGGLGTRDVIKLVGDRLISVPS